MRRDTRNKEEGPLYLTAEGLDRLREELARLRRALPDLAAEAARTAAYGDRSDNAEYKDAKARLRRANFRVLEIEEDLKRVVLIHSGVAGGVVGLGATVELESDGVVFVFEIVGPAETNPSRGRISHVSPLGAELIGKKEGASVTLPTGKTYRIRDVR